MVNIQYEKPKVLNNFVAELLNVEINQPKSHEEYNFVNPRYGWIFLTSTVEVGEKEKPIFTLDSAPKEEAIAVHQTGKTKTLEATRLLPAGRHTLHVWCKGNPLIKNVVVRSVPTIVYCQLGAGSNVPEYGSYDWNFLRKHILHNINTLIAAHVEKHAEEWKKQGKRWINYSPLPGLQLKTVSAEESYQYWTEQRELKNPYVDGLIVDEFYPSLADKFPAWTSAIKRIHDNQEFKGKVFIPWVSGDPEGLKSFMGTIDECGYPFAWERYLREQTDTEEAKRYIEKELKTPLNTWRKIMNAPQRSTILCLGFMSQPPESLNTNPSVDWKVFMDLEFNFIANDPAFQGLYGVMEYLSSYADEETIRWAGRLFRHYCIEGRTEMLSTQYGFKYHLDHIENPDFNEGTKGWMVEAAEKGSVDVKHMAGFSWLEGRYPRTTEGDNFLWTKRSNKAPNIFSQDIRNLKKGRLYSLKMYTADYRDFTEGKSLKQKHAVSIKLEGVRIVPERCFQHVFPNCYDHHLGPFNTEHRAWMNYHYRVFEACGNTAKLTISDWISEEVPGGPIGQELMYNFIEVQPYLEFEE